MSEKLFFIAGILGAITFFLSGFVTAYALEETRRSKKHHIVSTAETKETFTSAMKNALVAELKNSIKQSIANDHRKGLS